MLDLSIYDSFLSQAQHTPLIMVLYGLCLVCNLVVCFYGFKLHQVAIWLVGFMNGFILGAVISGGSNGWELSTVLIATLVGVIFGIMFLKILKAIVMIIGGWIGFLAVSFAMGLSVEEIFSGLGVMFEAGIQLVFRGEFDYSEVPGYTWIGQITGAICALLVFRFYKLAISIITAWSGGISAAFLVVLAFNFNHVHQQVGDRVLITDWENFNQLIEKLFYALSDVWLYVFTLAIVLFALGFWHQVWGISFKPKQATEDLNQHAAVPTNG